MALAHDGSGDGHPLALTPGELVGEVWCSVGQTETLEGFHPRPRAFWAGTPSSSSGSDTFSTAVDRPEVVVLKDVPDHRRRSRALSLRDMADSDTPPMSTLPLVGS